MKNRVLIALLLALGVGLAGYWLYSTSQPAFPGLSGPSTVTSLPTQPRPDPLHTYASDHSFGIGLYVRDPASSWLGLAHGLNSLGVPFRVVTRLEEALQHRVVMIYPSLTGANTTPDMLASLMAHVETGGTLVGFSVVGGGARTLFGYGESREHGQRRSLALQTSATTNTVPSAGAASTIMLGSHLAEDTGLPGVHYLDPDEAPLARFNDGSGAILRKTHGTGHAYAFGIDVGHYILRAHNGRFPNLSDTYVNAFQPQVDTLLRIIKAIYREGDPDAITLSPTPHGRDFTALVTHDVDFTRSMNNVPYFAAVAVQHGVPATYFIQTKYVTDYNDRAFFDASRIPALRTLVEQGMEIASHTVAHSNEFQRMPTGTGTEQYPEYRPFVFDFTTVHDATILGELRVSRFLLEETSGAHVRAFRPGHLSFPQQLPQLLAATGYEFSSSMTANEALTHLPFRMMHDRGYTAAVPVFEFPVTIEDEAGILGERFDEAVALSESVAHYRGLVNILIHTDERGHKIDFLDRYLSHFRERAWFDTVSGYGNWWRARDAVQLSLKMEGEQPRLTLYPDEALEGLTLILPPGWRYQSGLPGTRQSGQQLVLGPLTRTTTLRLNRESAP
ncbi:MAG: hypothetical protein C0462_05850 [Alcanivorax sp.]|nr:hypothetical protein [Alcanivorax sp.]